MKLFDCPIKSPYIQTSTSPTSRISNEANITVTVSGVVFPGNSDWIAMVSPSTTGDLSHLPLLWHYPVKAEYLTNDPGYLSCKMSEYKIRTGRLCLLKTSSGSITFEVVNIRTDIVFAFFSGFYDTPCVLKRGTPLKLANPKSPLIHPYSITDRIQSSSSYKFKYGRTNHWLLTLPKSVPDTDRLSGPPGALFAVEAMIAEVASSNVDAIYHIGDISYATDFLVEWDYFLSQITPPASSVSYMTAIGNHERDYITSGSVYRTPDSGGECGVAYEAYFAMPTTGKDKPWH
ncbi:hypothetical protein Ancab_019837 [Ancistrocladus abbreviatus]